MKPIVTDDPRDVFNRVPFMQLLGVQRAFSEGGRARLLLPPRPELGNVIGGVHGGAVTTLLDVVMASAAVSACDFRLTAVTLSMETQFLEPGRGQLTADGELLQEADGIAFCRAQVTDEAGRSVAHAQGSFRYLPRPTAPEPIPIPFPIPEKQP